MSISNHKIVNLMDRTITLIQDKYELKEKVEIIFLRRLLWKHCIV